MQAALPSASPAFFAPSVVNAFEDLEVAITLWHAGHWTEIFERLYAPSLLGFELRQGAATERAAYNQRCLDEALRRKGAVIGRHNGFADLFVPIPGTEAILVTGPFATERPSGVSVLEGWRAMTGRQGHPADPEFSEYVTLLLSMLVLEGPLMSVYQRLVECLALLMSGSAAAAELFAEIESLRAELSPARIVERVWRGVRGMLDERSARAWTSRTMRSRLWRLGLSRCPEQLCVALCSSRDKDPDPVDDVLRRHAFQRACVELTRKNAETISGQVGEQGIVLMCSGSGRGGAQRARRQLQGLSNEASALARQSFGLALHVGLPGDGKTLPDQYREALSAAHLALARGSRLISANEAASTDQPLRRLRSELAEPVRDDPKPLLALFERYVAAVRARVGQRLEPASLALESGFERAAEAVLGSAALEAPIFRSVASTLERAEREAATVDELVDAYTAALQKLAKGAFEPVLSGQERSLERAEEYLRRHYAEPLSLPRVARVAGFAPNYFSRIFRERRGITFERYLLQLRLARARQLLSSTDLSLQRVAQLSGFSTRQHFGAIFRRHCGETPGRFRARDDKTYNPEESASDARRRREGGTRRR